MDNTKKGKETAGQRAHIHEVVELWKNDDTLLPADLFTLKGNTKLLESGCWKMVSNFRRKRTQAQQAAKKKGKGKAFEEDELMEDEEQEEEEENNVTTNTINHQPRFCH